MSFVRHATPRLRRGLALVDSAALLLALWLAHLVRFDPEARSFKWVQLLASPALLMFMVLAGWMLAVAAELYELQVLHRRRETLVRIVAMVSAWSATIALATYLYPTWAFGRGILLLTACAWGTAMLTLRFSITSWLRQRSRFTALVVGDPEVVAPFCRELAARPAAPWQPVDGSHLEPAAIPAAVNAQGIDVVILAGGDEHVLQMGADLTALHFSGVPVVAASEIWAWLEERLPLAALTPVVFLHQPGFGGVHWTLFNRFTRIADIVLACCLLLLALPILLLAGLLIWGFNGRPVIYQQARVGQFGRPFTLFKLRTMQRQAEAHGPTFATRDDPRATRIGAILRRFRLDELPQLWNVILGEMSLVGPRPERPEFVAELSAKIPYYAFRTAVPPGLSGWAQVNTSYARTLEDHQRKLEYDLYFIRERSVRLYLLALLRTVSVALFGVRP